MKKLLTIEFLKVPYHGSKTGLDEDVIKLTSVKGISRGTEEGDLLSILSWLPRHADGYDVSPKKL